MVFVYLKKKQRYFSNKVVRPIIIFFFYCDVSFLFVRWMYVFTWKVSYAKTFVHSLQTHLGKMLIFLLLFLKKFDF